MRKIILALAILIGTAYTLDVKAQQDARYTQYMFNKMALNPGYTGSNEGLSIAALYRTQWVNIDGAPTSVTLSAHAPLGDAKKIGLGGFLEYDNIGVHQQVNAFAAYSYKFILGESRLSIGLQGGISYRASNFTNVDGNSMVVTSIDNPFLNDERRLLPNFGVGLYYYKPNSFYVGAAAPHLLNNNLRDDDPTISRTPHQERHYNFMGGMVFGRDFKIMPSALVKLVPSQAPVQFDANVLLSLKEIIWLGASYRFAVGNTDNALESESVNAIVAFQVKQLRIGYAYDYTLSDLGAFAMPLGSHEVSISYDMKGKGVRYYTPRHF